MDTVVYPGTFDPITNGHTDLVERASRLFDRVLVAVAASSDKHTAFPLEIRVSLARDVLAHIGNVEVCSFGNLLVDFMAQQQARVILRGLRAVSDFEYEFQLALMNRRLERHVETVFLMTGFRWIFISSSIIKDAAQHGGDVSGLVPEHVQQMLKEKYGLA